MDSYCVKFETLVCAALAVVTVATVGVLLNAVFSASIVA